MYRRSEYEDDILKAVYMPEVGQRPSSRFRTTFAQQCRARTQPDLSRGNLRRGAPGPLHPCPAQLGRGVLGLAGTSISEVPHRGPHREGPDIGTSHRKQGTKMRSVRYQICVVPHRGTTYWYLTERGQILVPHTGSRGQVWHSAQLTTI